jgi:hypothetical protein
MARNPINFACTIATIVWPRFDERSKVSRSRSATPCPPIVKGQLTAVLNSTSSPRAMSKASETQAINRRLCTIRAFGSTIVPSDIVTRRRTSTGALPRGASRGMTIELTGNPDCHPFITHGCLILDKLGRHRHEFVRRGLL